MKHSSEEIEKCIAMLEGLAKDAGELANLPDKQRIALLKAAGEISRPDRAERKKEIRPQIKYRPWQTLKKTGAPEMPQVYVPRVLMLHLQRLNRSNFRHQKSGMRKKN